MRQDFKIPKSVLVVIYTPDMDVLLIRRADGYDPGVEFWQSVTGSQDTEDEPWAVTAAREVWEETGLDCRAGSAGAALLHDWDLENVYTIYPQWLHRYAPGVVHNTEHLFGFAVPSQVAVQLNPREHTAYQWLGFRQAAEQCFSPSNAEAILNLPAMIHYVKPLKRVSV